MHIHWHNKVVYAREVLAEGWHRLTYTETICRCGDKKGFFS